MHRIGKAQSVATSPFSIRIAEGTKQKVRRVACARGLSMNAYIAEAIEDALSGEAQLREFTRKSL